MKKLNLWTIVIMAVLLLIPVVVLADASVELFENETLYLAGNGANKAYTKTNPKNSPTWTPYEGVIEIKPHNTTSVDGKGDRRIDVQSGDHTVKTAGSMSLQPHGNTGALAISDGASINFAGGEFIMNPSDGSALSSGIPSPTDIPVSLLGSGSTLTVSGGSVTVFNNDAGQAIGNKEGTINGKIIDIDGGVRIVPAEEAETEMTTDYTLDSLYKTLLASIKDSKGVTVSFVDGNFIFDMEGEDAFISLVKELNLGDFTKGMTVLGVKAVFNYDGNTVTLTGAELIGQFTGSKYRENVRFEGETLLACAYDEGAKRITIAK